MSSHRFLLLACLALPMTGCQGDRAPPSTGTAPAASSSRGPSAEAESSVDGAIVHVSVVQTSQLPESVAREYSLDRSPRTILLLVNLRNLGSAPAPLISATVTDLMQHTTPVSLRAVHVVPADADTADYVGTVDATPPDTLRFTVIAKRGGATATVEVSRDFYPQ
jgi:hypothetical protein